jgi:hypothetical protein
MVTGVRKIRQAAAGTPSFAVGSPNVRSFGAANLSNQSRCDDKKTDLPKLCVHPSSIAIEVYFAN